MAEKPKASCLFFLPAQIFPQRQIIKSDIPAVFSDVMPLWFGLIPGGCTKGSAAIWSVILQLWLKHRNFHLGEDDSLSPPLALNSRRAHVQRRRWYQMQLTIFVPADVKSFLSLSSSSSLHPLLLLSFFSPWKKNVILQSVNVFFPRLYKWYFFSLFPCLFQHICRVKSTLKSCR